MISSPQQDQITGATAPVTFQAHLGNPGPLAEVAVVMGAATMIPKTQNLRKYLDV